MNGSTISKGLSPARFLPYGILLLASFLLYWKSTGFDFIYSCDDRTFITSNPLVQGLDFDRIKRAFTSQHFGSYAPFHVISYMIDYSIWGLNPGGFHLTNVILHAINSCLAFIALNKLTGKRHLSFIAAMLFAVHPLNVENVAWIAERKTLLTALFSFIAVTLYVKFRETGLWKFYALTVVFFVFALLSKPLAIVFPLIIALYEVCLGKGWRGLLPALPLFPVSAILSRIAVASHQQEELIRAGTLNLNTLLNEVYPTMLPVYWKYLKILVWPFNLSGFYDTARYGSFLAWPVLTALLGLIALFVAVLWKGSAKVRFWFLWFWIWLLPVSNIIPIPVFYADRYMYLPGIAFFVLMGEAILAIKGRIDGVSTRAVASIAAASVIILFYGIVAFNRLDVWKNEVVFLEDTERKSPNEDGVHIKLGFIYEKMGRLDDAEREFLAAVRIYPDPEIIAKLEAVRYKKTFQTERTVGN